MNTYPKPSVNVTLHGPDDGGDFGPHTPGTRTSGIQEALDYAHANCRDVYIHGGRGGVHDGVGTSANVYTLDETLRVPWSQDFTLGGGNYLLHYRPATGDAVVIDSQMNCRYKFGLIVTEADGAAVRIKPATPGPDDFVVVTASAFDFSALVARNYGLVLDSSEGSIMQSRIVAEETNTRGTGIYLTGSQSAKGINGNTIHIPYNQQYHASRACTNLRVGDPGCTHITHNRLEMSLHAPRGVYFDEVVRRYISPPGFVPPADAIGAQIFGQDNLLTLTFHGQRSPGSDLVFESGSRDNTVFLYNLPNGITNRAEAATNRVMANWAVGFGVKTPAPAASGELLVNRTSFSVDVYIVTAGQVSEWTIVDSRGAEQSIAAGLLVGQVLRLDPGEGIRLIYTDAPTWRWKALR
jgi:hypothetical protein